LSTYDRCGSAKTEQLNREFKMSLKKASVAAVIAVSMASTPILAQTVQTSAAPLSVAARSGAVVSGEASDLRGGFIIPLIAIVAIILGILAATGGKDRPHSP
jgi:sugar phosphate permease